MKMNLDYLTASFPSRNILSIILDQIINLVGWWHQISSTIIDKCSKTVNRIFYKRFKIKLRNYILINASTIGGSILVQFVFSNIKK